ncbi:MAG: hypothetical protein H0V45_09045 [Actinobacteria bacterium]|nr:hypothetical protein [Actinomycetota bacterium]
MQNEVGTWATENRFGGGAIYSVDEVAKESSDWADADAEGISATDQAVQASRDCVTGG